MKQRQISKKKIRRAGDSLAAGHLSESERIEALELVGHWRTAHIVLEELTAASDSMFVTYEGEIDRSSSCLLAVDLGMQQVDIEVFSPEDEVSAADKYTELETGKEKPGIIYLLARAGSLKDLRFAYPNYSSDISQFVGWLTKTING